MTVLTHAQKNQVEDGLAVAVEWRQAAKFRLRLLGGEFR